MSGRDRRNGERGSASLYRESGAWAKPPEADEVFVFKTLIFNTSAGALHQIMCCLVCLFFVLMQSGL